MLPKVKSVLDRILSEFAEGKNIPEAIAYATFPIPNLPSSSWSLMNQLMMIISGTRDARGFRQWKEVNRFVKKGSTAIPLLVPFFNKVDGAEENKEVKILSGFSVGNVFRYEDTDGEPLEYENLELPKLPLLEKAAEWGITVKAVPGSDKFNGYFLSDQKLIALATPEEKTFFHELSHVAHEKILGQLKRTQDPLQEIVAELSAQALCRIVGKDGDKLKGNSYKYITRYAEEIKLTPHAAVLRVVSDVEKVLKLILSEKPKAEKIAV